LNIVVKNKDVGLIDLVEIASPWDI